MSKGLLSLETVVWTVLVIAVTPFILYIVPQLLGVDAYIVTSGSMEPTIPEGSVVYEQKTNPDTLQKGDVVVFKPNNSQIQGETVVHRITDTQIANYTRQLQTKGDNNPEPDPGWTPSYNIIGKQAFTIPHLGTIIQTANKPAFIALLVGLPVTILLKNQIQQILKEIEKTPEKPKNRRPLRRKQTKNQ